MNQKTLDMDDLKLPYSEWKKRLKEVELTDDVKQWLHVWELYDLAISPMDDEERRFIRYGHFIGWFDSKNPLYK